MCDTCQYDCDDTHRRVVTNRRLRNMERTSGILLLSSSAWIVILQTILLSISKMSGSAQFVAVVEVSAFHILHQPQQQRHISTISRRHRRSIPSLSLIAPSSFFYSPYSSKTDNTRSHMDGSFRTSKQYLPKKDRRYMVKLSATSNLNIVDAEFIPIDDSNKDGNMNDNVPSQQQKSETTIRSDKSLLDMSFELDDEFMNSRIPFIDTTVPTDTGSRSRGSNTEAGGTTMTKNNYIDVKLAFMVTLDNVQYGIGIPYDAAAAITCEQPDGTIEYVSPDIEVDGSGSNSDDDMTELIAIMATQLQEYIGADVQLQHTPRVLTISGNIDQYTKDWERTLLPQAINATQLLDTLTTTAKTTDAKNNDDVDDDNDDPELAFFHNLMREELGQAEYDKIMNDDTDGDDESEEMQELMKLFEAPLGASSNGRSNEEETMKEMLSTLLTPEQELENAKKTFGLLDPQQPDYTGSSGSNSTANGYMALKLISYMFANGKSYSLVQLLQPYVIVGKYALSSSSSSNDNNDENPNGEDDDIEDDDRNTNYSESAMGYFELLLPEEEQIVIPRLEAVCSEDLQKANLQFQK